MAEPGNSSEQQTHHEDDDFDELFTDNIIDNPVVTAPINASVQSLGADEVDTGPVGDTLQQSSDTRPPRDPSSSTASSVTGACGTMPSITINGGDLGMSCAGGGTDEVDGDLLSLNNELDNLLDPTNNLCTPTPLISLPPFECLRLQKEELETLTAIYTDDINVFSETCFVINVQFLTDDIRKDDVIKLWFSFPASYPSVPPVFEIEACRSGVCTYSDADDLYDLFLTESLKKVGDMMVFDLVTIAQEFMASLVETKQKLEAEREASQLPTKEDENTPQKPPQETGSGAPYEEDPNPNPIKKKVDSLLWAGVLIRPSQILGRMSDIIRKLPEDLEVTRIENVLRQDLAVRFCKTLKQASEKLWKSERLFPHEINLKAQTAFHGTLVTNLPSIVQRGLVIPGLGNSVRVRCGSSLGLGIYLSPSAQYSLSYSSSDRLIVCAALQGRIYKEGASSKAPSSSYFSVVSQCGNEWVFFNAGQVLPCYVIKVRKKNLRKPEPPPLSHLMDIDIKEEESAEKKRRAMAARAAKFLPYGFGPGRKTVIEDIASFDDDEEYVGSHQELPCELQAGSEFQEFRYKYPGEKS